MVTGASWVHFKPGKTKIGQKTSLTPFFHRPLQFIHIIPGTTFIEALSLEEAGYIHVLYTGTQDTAVHVATHGCFSHFQTLTL